MQTPSLPPSNCPRFCPWWYFTTTLWKPSRLLIHIYDFCLWEYCEVPADINMVGMIFVWKPTKVGPHNAIQSSSGSSGPNGVRFNAIREWTLSTKLAANIVLSWPLVQAHRSTTGRSPHASHDAYAWLWTRSPLGLSINLWVSPLVTGRQFKSSSSC